MAQQQVEKKKRAPLTPYPPPNPVHIWPKVYPPVPETYAPLLNPPLALVGQLPKLPHGQRPQSSLPDAIGRTHVLSAHIAAAAWPRVNSELYVESQWAPPPNETKEERKARVKRHSEFLAQQSYDIDNGLVATWPKRSEVLYNAWNRYARKTQVPGGLTLIVTHAVGFPKEAKIFQIWEPAYAQLIEATESSGSRVKINEIWGFEATNAGDSALINEGRLPIHCPWTDNGRDILNFVLHYLPDQSTSGELPVNLPRLPDHIATSRRVNGFGSSRTLVGVGHSAGTTALFHGAIHEPKLYSSLMGLDPILLTTDVNRGPQFSAWITGAIGRRSQWPSREEAHKLLAASPSFSYWDPRVLEMLVKYGITEDPKNGPTAVKLKMPVFLEACTFADKRSGIETFEQLPLIDPKTDIRYIYNGVDPVATGGLRTTQHAAWRRPVNVSNKRIKASHLMIQQSPNLVGKEIYDFLQLKYGSSGSKARL
ncbi:uncharacterized protein EI90DRAFT_2921583 [Cantharellus anzutake]|uniref:uncharacterized protein n=1 Tax=Cantharellus anzutake TaxID=1750568 RepID=UPI001903D8D5|nr:uncharacterized protein EI90DRAFT_2921583 [Cantharellus anzutake]KAF8330805.1 hypothetical protein EI90DRAFT_2921583 [Cantharellus anzutake]